MADLMLNHVLVEQNITGVTVTSAGIGNWHEGSEADERTKKVLQEYGYPTNHIAKQITKADLAADLLAAMDRSHQQALQKLGADPNRIRLLRSFSIPPTSELEVADPYYGDLNSFREVRHQIEVALPGIINWITYELEKI